MSNLSWVDIAIALLLIRGFYIVKKSNFISELFKFIGVVCAVVVALHLYGRFAKVLTEQFLIPEDYSELCALAILSFVTVLIFRFVREGWLVILKIDVHTGVDKWGALIISSIKNILLCSLIVVGILISGNKYLVKSAKHSFSQGILKPVSINLYKFVFDIIIEKYFHDEKINNKATALLSSENVKDIN